MNAPFPEISVDTPSNVSNSNISLDTPANVPDQDALIDSPVNIPPPIVENIVSIIKYKLIINSLQTLRLKTAHLLQYLTMNLLAILHQNL